MTNLFKSSHLGLIMVVYVHLENYPILTEFFNWLEYRPLRNTLEFFFINFIGIWHKCLFYLYIYWFSLPPSLNHFFYLLIWTWDALVSQVANTVESFYWKLPSFFIEVIKATTSFMMAFIISHLFQRVLYSFQFS